MMNPSKNEVKEMRYAVAYLNIVPLRAEASHRSEMVSQLLFGEYMKVFETKDEWSYIQLEHDSYKGWVQSIQLHLVDEKEYLAFQNSTKVKALSDFSTILVDGDKVTILKGTNLPFYANGFFMFRDKKISYSAEVISQKQSRQKLIETAKSYLNTPYLWGGKTLAGIDCSGFSQMVYHINGYTIKRDASLQAQQGSLVAFLTQAQEGDLAFFENEEAKITHVGIILADEKIIHAAQGKVRIDKLDQEGIYNEELKKYTHHLRMVKSYF